MIITVLGSGSKANSIVIQHQDNAIMILERNQAVLFKEWNNIRIGDFEVTPISVSHDSVSPVGFVVKAGGEKLSLVTDAGELSRKSKDAMKDSSVIMLESNHDSEMLHKSSRLYFLKKRISGVKGHLSNEKSAEVLSEIISSRTSDVILLHLSGECNTPELARKAAFDKNPALKTGLVKLHITSQNEICRISVTQQPVVLGELSRNSSCSSTLCGNSKP